MKTKLTPQQVTSHKNTPHTKASKTQSFWRIHYPIILIVVAFSATVIPMICAWYNYQLNPDATSYMTIAQTYAAGHLRMALNGYWGPLFSWLLVPAVWMGVSLIVAAKCVLAFTAAGILLVLYTFLYKKGTSRLLANFVCLAAALLLMPWVIVEAITPDLLVAFWSLLLVVLLDQFMERPRIRLAIGIGFLGALMYFTKGFGLFLFIGVVGALALWQWRQERTFLLVVKRYAPIAITLLVLIAPFIGLVSQKYGQLTISNAGSYDHRIFGPVALDNQPIESAGPLVPPNKMAISAWEDPTTLTKLVPGWNIVGHDAQIKFFFESVLARNINRTIQAVTDFGPLIAFGAITIVLGCLQRSNRRREFGLLALVSGMMTLGYLPVLTQDRYLWGAAILALAALAMWADGMRAKKIFTTVQFIVVGTVVCAVMLLASLQEIFQYKYVDQQYYLVAMSLRHVLPKNAKLISDNFNQSYYDCFYLKIQCFNVVAPPASNTQAYYEYLKQLGITDYVDYHTRDGDVALQQFVQTYFTQIDQRVVDQVPVTTYSLTKP